MRVGVGLAGIAGIACVGAGAMAQSAGPIPSAEASATVATQQGGANRAVVVTDGGSATIVGTAELGGLENYDPAGKRISAIPAGEAVSVDV